MSNAAEKVQPKKVLIFEDNELNLKLFQDLLGAHGFVTVETRDGRNAVEIVSKEQPDLIIMDIQLPYVSGIDIIKTIKSEQDLKDIPIIAVTAFAMQDDKEKILSTGCEDYLSKPISIDSFVDVINKYVE